MPIVLKMIVKTRKRSNALYMGVYFKIISNNKYYIHAANLLWILVSSYYLKIYI